MKVPTNSVRPQAWALVICRSGCPLRLRKRALIREWIPADEGEPGFDLFDQRPDTGKSVEIRREDGSIFVLDSD